MDEKRMPSQADNMDEKAIVKELEKRYKDLRAIRSRTERKSIGM